MLKIKSLAGAFLLLLCSSLLHPCLGVSHRETVAVFQNDRTKIVYHEAESKTTTSKGFSITNPAFVSGLINKKKFFAILSNAVFYNPSKKVYRQVIASTSYKNHNTWSPAEVLTKISTKDKEYELCEGTTAVMNENKIYVLVATKSTLKPKDRGSPPKKVREPIIIVGTVMNRTDHSIDDVFINWEAQILPQVTRKNTVNGRGTFEFVGGGGNGIVTENRTIIFPIVLMQNSQTFSSTLYSVDDGKTWHIGEETEPGTNAGSLVEWNGGKLLFTVASKEGYRKVYESKDMGSTWKPSPVLFGVWGNQQYPKHDKTQGSAIAVSVDGNDVLLFSHPLNKNNYKHNTLQLWLSDGQRIVCVGTISDNEIEDNTQNSILTYIGEQLYVMHQINPKTPFSTLNFSMQKKWGNVIGITPLTDLFDNVFIKVSNWRVTDKRYKEKGIPINGIVGVLGNTNEKDNAVWADMYNCVNATVKGGESVSGGFRFDGAAGSGAKWPVKSQGQNQLYRFTEKEFTLTATITIHSTSEAEDISLIGAISSAKEDAVLIGLGYKKEENKWYVMQKTGENINTEVPVELEKEYKVAITFANEQGAVYVDGVNIANQNIPITGTVSIDHFFIGATGLSSPQANGNSCTAKNVMLFSRALEKYEIDKLKDITGISALNEAILTENERIEQEIKEAASTVKLQSAGETQDLTSSAQSTSKPGVRNTVLQNHIASASKTGKSDSNTESTIAPEGHQLVSNTPLTRTAEKQKTHSNNKEISTPKNTKTDLQAMVTTAPTSQEPLSKKKHHEETGIVQQSVTTAKDNDNQILNSLQKYGTPSVQTNVPGDNSAIVSLAAVLGMSLLCTLISMTVF